ncbi:Oidioi.mRNA.OKI2018_I69.chr1.g2862.t1.cds [Oikopleura dioica]|uniref:Oidioi.mRNA.OKI2018_I69.chr1.g2862.t1.cds n=1 Tax=Oikopleura dioica TaxID=34765 RepID=A0ABN7SU50_OIKDI|nr:Oidioi.mRNA.OKI2018_I69.chr1.g2862.t1.cds [Oikopleura dioica]
MNNALVNGGCFVRLSILDNIASFWELNPKTNRIRVIAPKTKAEPYPDYETDEDASARTIAGVCNREIPYGSDRATRKSRKRSLSESESEGESDGESEAEIDQFSNSEDEEEFKIKKLEQEAKTRRQKLQARSKRSKLSRKPVTRATSARRDARRVKIRKRRGADADSASPVVKSKRSGRVERSNFAEPEPVTKNPRKPLLRPSRLKEYPITSNDYRKWRSAISNASNRNSKRKRAIEFSDSIASDEDISEAESIANSVKSNSRVARINGRRRIREQTPFYNNAYDDADVDPNEDGGYESERISKRSKRKRTAGRVTTVRDAKSRKLANKPKSSSKNTVSPTSSAIKKSHYYDPDGIESRSDEESDDDRLYIDENESIGGDGGPSGGRGSGGADIDNFWG